MYTMKRLMISSIINLKVLNHIHHKTQGIESHTSLISRYCITYLPCPSLPFARACTHTRTHTYTRTRTHARTHTHRVTVMGETVVVGKEANRKQFTILQSSNSDQNQNQEHCNSFTANKDFLRAGKDPAS